MYRALGEYIAVHKKEVPSCTVYWKEGFIIQRFMVCCCTGVSNALSDVGYRITLSH